MDFKVILSTFVAVFIAELGDKTQLITFGASTSSPSKLDVFVGSASALVLASAIGVLAGGSLGHFISLKTLERVGGTIFILIGMVTLYKSFHT